MDIVILFKAFVNNYSATVRQCDRDSELVS